MLKEKFKALEDVLLAETERCYGERLVSLVLFGSAARGTQRFDSDVDFLIVARDLPRGRLKRVREFQAVDERLGPFLGKLRGSGINTGLSPVFKAPEEAEEGSPLFLDMVEDAKILFDRDGFFARRLERLRERLKALGAKRIWRGNAWYWDLKPDYKPGDVIEL
ncbi:MAG: nucleotidyltransferase domain-containing protein [Nitrospirae bacterium]|nr:nucleotidyltransferase domain-containing protein [Nitrospirota bacterium]